MVSIEQARSQVEARKTEIATAQRGIQARQAALPETGTQKALRMLRGIAGVPIKQRVEAEKQRLIGQREAVEQYGEQVGAYEKQIDVAATQRSAAQKEYAKAKEYFAEGIPSHQFSGNIKKYMDQMMMAQEYDYARGTRRGEYQEARAKYEGQIKELGEAGFKPVYGKEGELFGFEDPHAQMSIPLPQFEKHMEQYKAPEAPLVAYKDILTGKMEYVSKMAPGPMQVPVVVGADLKELSPIESAKFSRFRPDIQQITGIRDAPKKYIEDFKLPVPEMKVYDPMKPEFGTRMDYGMKAGDIAPEYGAPGSAVWIGQQVVGAAKEIVREGVGLYREKVVEPVSKVIDPYRKYVVEPLSREGISIGGRRIVAPLGEVFPKYREYVTDPLSKRGVSIRGRQIIAPLGEVFPSMVKTYKRVSRGLEPLREKRPTTGIEWIGKGVEKYKEKVVEPISEKGITIPVSMGVGGLDIRVVPPLGEPMKDIIKAKLLVEKKAKMLQEVSVKLEDPTITGKEFQRQIDLYESLGGKVEVVKTRLLGIHKKGEEFKEEYKFTEPTVKIGLPGQMRDVPISKYTGKGLYGFGKEVFLGEVEETFKDIATTRFIGATPKEARWIGKGVRLGTEIAPYFVPGVYAGETALKVGEAQFLKGKFGGPSTALGYIKKHPIEVGIAGALGAGSLWKGAKGWIPHEGIVKGIKVSPKMFARAEMVAIRKKAAQAGLSVKDYMLKREAMAIAQQKLAIEKAAKVESYLGRKEALTKVEAYGRKMGLPKTPSAVQELTAPAPKGKLDWQSIGIGAEKTGVKIKFLADDLVKSGIFASKKQALKAIKDAGVFQQISKTRLPPKLELIKGSLADIRKPVTLGQLKYSPGLGTIETPTYGVYVTQKVGKVTRGAIIQFQVGVGGKPVTKTITSLVGGDKFTRLVTFGSQRGPKPITYFGKAPYRFKKTEFPFAKRFGEEQVLKTKILSTQQVKDVLSGRLRMGRKTALDYRVKYGKSARVSPEEFTKEFMRAPPTMKEFKEAYPLLKEKAMDVLVYKKPKLGADAELYGLITPKGPRIIGGKVKAYVEKPYIQMGGGIKDEGLITISKIKDGGFGRTIISGLGKKSSKTYLKQLYKDIPSPVLLPKLLPKVKVPRVPTPKVIMAPPKPSVIYKAMAPSIWVGKGIYERTKGGLMPGVALAVPLIEAKEDRVPKVDMITIPAQILRPALKPSIKVAIRPKLKRELKPTLRPLLKLTPKAIVKPSVKVAVKPALRVALRPVLKPVVKPIVRPVAKPITRPVTRPRPPEPPKPQIPKPPIIIVLDKRKPKRVPKAVVRPIRKTGYEVEVKRKGKWEDVTPFALSKGEALALGRRETKAGAEVTFRLKKANGIGGTLGLLPISEAELRDEYRGRIVKGKEVKKPLTFIQKRKARIVTPGEFFAITKKGIAARKARTKEKGRIKWLGI